MVTPLTTSAIYSGGQLVGISDPIRQQSRLPTPTEQIIYGGGTKEYVPSKVVTEYKDIKLPDIPKTKLETYDPRLRMYVSTSPTGERETAYIRPPTMDEARRIEEAQRKGSFDYISGVVEEKIVTPALKFVEPVTEKIRDIPIGFGGADITLGKGITIAKEVSQQVADISKIGWLDISRRIEGKAEERGKGIPKNILETGSILTKGVSKVVEVTPDIVQYTALPLAGATGIDLLATEQKKADIDKYVDKALGEQYKIYIDDYKKQERNLKEGYELEPKLSKTEFIDKYGKEIREDVSKQIRKKAVIPFAILGTAGIFSAIKQYKTPFLIKVGERELEITTKGRKFFGGKIKVSKTEGGGILDTKFEFKPSEPLIVVKKQPAGVGKLPESILEVKPKVFSMSDEPTYKILEEFVTPIVDTKGASKSIIEGEKTIVSILTPAKLRIGLRRIDYVPKGQEIIFRGLSPYTQAGRLERARVLEEFSNLGIKPDVVKPLITLRYPKIIETKSDIVGFSTEGEKGLKLFLRAEEITTFRKAPFMDMFGTIFSRARKPIEKIKTFELFPSGKTLKDGEPIWKGVSLEYTSAGKLGRTTEQFDIFKVTKKVGEKEINLLPVEVEGVGVVSKPTTFEFYKQLDISRKVVPKTRKVEIGTGDIILKEPTQTEVIDLDEMFGLSKTDFRFIPTGGKKSSPQFFQQLYAPKQELLATGLARITKPPKVPTPKTPKTIFDEFIKETTPTSIWEGTGLYERTSGVSISQFGKPDTTISPITLTGITQPVMIDTKTRVETTPRTFQDITPKVDTRIDIKPSLRLFEGVKPVQREFERVGEKQIIKERLATRQAVRQIMREGLITKIATKTTTKPRTEVPKVPKIKIKLFPSTKTEDKEKKIDEDLFEAFTRKGGKDISLGKFQTLPSASKELFKTIREELRASGFVTKGGKKIKLNIGGTEFRRSRQDSFRIVEPKRRRIKKGTSEISQILGSRKSGGFFK